MPASIILILVLMLIPISLRAQVTQETKPRLSLEKLFTAGLFRSLPGQFMWQPEGNSFIYIQQGTLWRYDMENGEKRKLESIDRITSKLMEGRSARPVITDDPDASGRIDRNAVSLSPDGKMILGEQNYDIYIYNIETGEARFVTDDPDIELFQTFSPDSAKVAYVKNRDIYVTDLAGGEAKRLTDNGGNSEVWNGVADWVYEEELALRRAFWWAPASDKIAYLQFDTSPIPYFYIIDHLQLRPEPERQKFPLAGEANSIVKLGVVSLDGGETAWVDTGDETDFYLPRVHWTHSGRELSYQWMNRKQNRLELRFTDPATGRSRTAVVEESESWINPEGDWFVSSTNLLFLKDDSFLWGSERTGFRHIYYYDAGGSLVRQLTDGEWLVDNILGVSADEKTVYFRGTKESPLERHVYSVSIGGGEIKRFTEEEGTHYGVFSPDGRYFVRTYSNSKVPPKVSIYDNDGKLVNVLDDGEIPNLKNWDITCPEFLTLESKDGDTLYAMITKPPQFDPSRKYPVIVYVYGGPGVQVVTDQWQGYLYFLSQIVAARDYIVFSLDNRGSWGRGLAFESKVHRNLGNLELEDQIVGVEYLKSLPYVDVDNIGIMGGSYGGYMTFMAMFRAPEHFRAGVAISPGGAWESYDTIYTERYMGTPQDNPEGYKKGSPAAYARGLEGHLYIAHGLMDNNAHVQETVGVIEALLRAGKDFKLMLYPQERHGVNRPHHFLHLYRTMLEFFDEHLKN